MTAYNIKGDLAVARNLTAGGTLGTSAFTLPSTAGTNNQVLTSNGSGGTSWTTVSGSGTVTSVGLSSSGTVTIGGTNPVTGSGTITVDVDQANLSLSSIGGTLNLASQVTGTLATTHGGTGLTSFTANDLFYASSSSAIGQIAPTGTNTFLQWTGSAYQWVAGSGSGTVTSVATGGGLTGGPITTTGTVSLDIAGQTSGTPAPTDLLILWNGSAFYNATVSQVGSGGGLPTTGGTMTGAIAIPATDPTTSLSLQWVGNATQGFGISNTGSLNTIISGGTQRGIEFWVAGSPPASAMVLDNSGNLTHTGPTVTIDNTLDANGSVRVGGASLGTQTFLSNAITNTFSGPMILPMSYPNTAAVSIQCVGYSNTGFNMNSNNHVPELVSDGVIALTTDFNGNVFVGTSGTPTNLTVWGTTTLEGATTINNSTTFTGTTNTFSAGSPVNFPKTDPTVSVSIQYAGDAKQGFGFNVIDNNTIVSGGTSAGIDLIAGAVTAISINNSGYPTIVYTPTAAGNWAGTPPTTIQQAIDRMAALLVTLHGGQIP